MRQKSEPTADELRGEVLAASSEARDGAGRSSRRLEAHSPIGSPAPNRRSAKLAHDLDVAQAELARQLLAELRVAPAERRGEGGGGRRRKAGGPAPTSATAVTGPTAKRCVVFFQHLLSIFCATPPGFPLAEN